MVKYMNKISSIIKDIKQQQINSTKEDNEKLKKEYRKILFMLIALISDSYIKYSNSILKIERMKTLNEIEKELIKYKKLLINSQNHIITTSLHNNFINAYDSHYELLRKFKNVDVDKRIFNDGEINAIIQAEYYKKTLDKRIYDNTSIILNQTYDIIDDSLKNDKNLEDIIIPTNDLFNITLVDLEERLLNTESTRIFNNAQGSIFKDFAISHLIWCSTLCENTCSECASNDGHPFSINDIDMIPLHSRCNCYWEIA